MIIIVFMLSEGTLYVDGAGTKLFLLIGSAVSLLGLKLFLKI